MRGSVAVFVKTIGLSPVKTRLAKSVGKENAENFYRLSVKCTQQTLDQSPPSLKKYWAVAEKEGVEDSRWNSFETLFQGEGDLGDRLDRIYSTLLKEFDYALLLGSDCPHMPLGALEEAHQALQKSPFVIGPSEDGGFYLFGGREPISHSVWKEVPYSVSSTAEILASKLPGEVQKIKPEFDIDTSHDLERLRTHASLPVELLSWFENSAWQGPN